MSVIAQNINGRPTGVSGKLPRSGATSQTADTTQPPDAGHLDAEQNVLQHRCSELIRKSVAASDRSQQLRKVLVHGLISVVLVLVNSFMLAATLGEFDWFTSARAPHCLHHKDRKADSPVGLGPFASQRILEGGYELA